MSYLEAYSRSYLRQEVVAEAQAPRTTVYESFDILRETLMVHELPPWKRSLKRKPVSSSRGYFFDVGVTGILTATTQQSR